MFWGCDEEMTLRFWLERSGWIVFVLVRGGGCCWMVDVMDFPRTKHTRRRRRVRVPGESVVLCFVYLARCQMCYVAPKERAAAKSAQHNVSLYL